MPLNAPQPAMPVCTHERRPGTAVCLHCRHAAIEAARARRKKVMLRGAAGAIVLAVVSAAGILSASAIKGRIDDNRAARKATRVVASSEGVTAAATNGAPAVTTPAVTAPVAQQGEIATVKSAPLVPVIPEGETMLRDSVIAVRTDSAVMISFDRPMLRTRMPVKFEQFLRATLSQVYGVAADSVLAALPDGAIAEQGDLLNELPARGIRIPVKDAWAIAVFPETRPGQDGPLVVRYRATVIVRD